MNVRAPARLHPIEGTAGLTIDLAKTARQSENVLVEMHLRENVLSTIMNRMEVKVYEGFTLEPTEQIGTKLEQAVQKSLRGAPLEPEDIAALGGRTAPQPNRGYKAAYEISQIMKQGMLSRNVSEWDKETADKVRQFAKDLLNSPSYDEGMKIKKVNEAIREHNSKAWGVIGHAFTKRHRAWQRVVDTNARTEESQIYTLFRALDEAGRELVKQGGDSARGGKGSFKYKAGQALTPARSVDQQLDKVLKILENVYVGEADGNTRGTVMNDLKNWNYNLAFSQVYLQALNNIGPKGKPNADINSELHRLMGISGGEIAQYGINNTAKLAMFEATIISGQARDAILTKMGNMADELAVKIDDIKHIASGHGTGDVNLLIDDLNSDTLRLYAVGHLHMGMLDTQGQKVISQILKDARTKIYELNGQATSPGGSAMVVSESAIKDLTKNGNTIYNMWNLQETQDNQALLDMLKAYDQRVVDSLMKVLTDEPTVLAVLQSLADHWQHAQPLQGVFRSENPVEITADMPKIAQVEVVPIVAQTPPTGTPPTP